MNEIISNSSNPYNEIESEVAYATPTGSSNGTKFIQIIIDDFSSLSLDFPNVELYDYGANFNEIHQDIYAVDYWGTKYNYGDTDAIISDTSTGHGIL